MTRYSFCTSYSYDILHPLTKTKETTLDEKFDVATLRIDFRSLNNKWRLFQMETLISREKNIFIPSIILMIYYLHSFPVLDIFCFSHIRI